MFSLPLHLQGLPSNRSWSTQQCKLQGAETSLANALFQGTLILISDGSYKESEALGTAAFRLEDYQQDNYLEGVLRTPGRPKDLESQRAELSGIYG